jgi:hypothetical protein
MALALSGTDMMEHLWEQLDKTKDGKHIRYTKVDVDQLWHMGFADTERVGLEQWRNIFEPYRQKDGTFILNRDEFLALDEYRYKGEIHVPFDAMLINEGRYTDEGLDELVEASIAPSCDLQRDKLNEFFSKLRKDFRQPDGLILIRKEAKQRIKAVLEAHPSPLRNLEVLLDKMIEKHGDEIEDALDKYDTQIATMEAARQISHFSSAPTTKVEAKAKAYESVTKVKQRKSSRSGDEGGEPKVELKKIRRSRKGFRG